MRFARLAPRRVEAVSPSDAARANPKLPLEFNILENSLREFADPTKLGSAPARDLPSPVPTRWGTLSPRERAGIRSQPHTPTPRGMRHPRVSGVYYRSGR